jgi:hypothetical protein
LSVYDAAYLELAQRNGVPLATLDADLQKAAAVEGVALLSRGDVAAAPSQTRIRGTVRAALPR